MMQPVARGAGRPGAWRQALPFMPGNGTTETLPQFRELKDREANAAALTEMSLIDEPQQLWPPAQRYR